MAAESIRRTERLDIPAEAAAEPGSFDLRDFEVVRGEFLCPAHLPTVTFREQQIQFNTACVRTPGWGIYAELLINPMDRRFAVRPTDEKDRCAVRISKFLEGAYKPRAVAAAAFTDTLFSLLGWKQGYRYRIAGTQHKSGKETVCVFNAANAEILLPPDCLPEGAHPLVTVGKRVRAIPKAWSVDFGQPFYLHEKEMGNFPEDISSLRRPAEAGNTLCITARDELRQYIEQELPPFLRKEDSNE